MEWLSDGLYPTGLVGSSPGTFLFEPAKARIFLCKTTDFSSRAQTLYGVLRCVR
jgi:hypothetical protein